MPNDGGPGVEARKVGARLREARIALGQDPADLARDLRIRKAWLLAIEEGHLDELPGAPYRIGFVRSYANRLGLDGAALAARLRPAPEYAAGRSLRGIFSTGEWRLPCRRILTLAARLVPAAATATGGGLRRVFSPAGGRSPPNRRVSALAAVLTMTAGGAWYLAAGADVAPVREEAGRPSGAPQETPDDGDVRSAQAAALAPVPSLPEPDLSPETVAAPSDLDEGATPAGRTGETAGPPARTGTAASAPAAGDEAVRPMAGPRRSTAPGPPRPGQIRAVQHSLARLGYDPGPEDGRLGPRTRAAIRAYQAASGLTADGRLTPELERGIRADAAATGL